MPIYSAAGASLRLSTDLPDVTNFTMMAWVFVGTMDGVQDGGSFAIMNDDGLFAAPYIWVGVDGATGKLTLKLHNGTTTVTDLGTTLAEGWYHFALTKSGSACTVYLSTDDLVTDCVADCSASQATGVTPVYLFTFLPAFPLLPSPTLWAVVNVKTYEAVLTVTQIRQERGTVTNPGAIGTYSNTPLMSASDVSDWTNDGHNWTVSSGSLASVVDGILPSGEGLPAVLTPSYITTPSTQTFTVFYPTWQSAEMIGGMSAWTWRGSWDENPGTLRTRPMTAYKGGRNLTETFESEVSVTNPYSAAMGRWVLTNLAAQTISGTFDLIMGVRENDAAANIYWKLYMYVTVGQTDAVRGVLLNNYEENTTNEWPTTFTATALQGAQTLSNVVCEAGDCLVLEVGYIARNASTTTYNGRMYVGSVDQNGAPATALTVGDLNVTEECGTFTFGTAVTLLMNPPVTNDLIASNEALYIFDSNTGLLKRVVVLPGSGVGVEPTGGAQFSTDANIYIGDETQEWVYVMDPTMSQVVDTFPTTPGAKPHALAVDRDNRYYVGFGGDGPGGSSCGMDGISLSSEAGGAIRKYDSSGNLLAVYNATFGASGTNAIDLSRDQARIFYTSLDDTIRVFNVQTNAQEDDFGTVPGAVLRGIRILPDEGVIVAHEAGLTRFNSSGTIVQTYTVEGQGNWGTVALSSNGAIVWGANTAWELISGFPPMIAKWGVESGDVLLKITENVLDTAGNLCSGGINIWNEYRDSISGPEPEDEESDDILGEATELPIRWVRRTPVLSQENLRVFVSKLTLDIQTGVGLVSGQGSDPVVMFRYSIDGGYQWSNERQLSVGAIGMYLTQVQTWRLGYGRQWVFEFSGSDPVTLGLLDLYFLGDVGDS